MPGNAGARAADPGAAVSSLAKTSTAEDTATAPAPQGLPPIERHDPIPTDKIALFELAPVRRLVGTWQGPGTIKDMRARR
jgi:hypothetical protein